MTTIHLFQFHSRQVASGLARAAALCVVLLADSRPAQAGPDAVSVNGDTATAQGNQSTGISSSVDFSTPPVSILNVFSLSSLIQPGSSIPGISFLNGSGGNVTVNSGVTGANVGIQTSGNNGVGIVAQSVGTPSANPPKDPFLNIPIPTDAAVAGGVVSVNSYSDITTTGVGAHGIVARSSTTGYPDSVIQQLQSFTGAGISFSVESVAGFSTNIGQVVQGSLIDTNGNYIAGSGGTFTLNANGTYTFNPGNDFTNMVVGETRQAIVTYGVYGTSPTATNHTTGTLVVAVTRTASGFTTQPGTYSSQYGPSGNTSSVLPDLKTYVAGLINLAAAGGAGNSVSVTNNGTISTLNSNSHGIFAESQGGQGPDGSGGSISSSADAGGNGRDGGTVHVTANGTNTTSMQQSSGVVAHSLAGNGGQGGDGGTWRYGARGGNGGNGGQVAVDGNGTITTSGQLSSGIIALSQGGNGGDGGSGKVATGGGNGGYGGQGGTVNVNGSWYIVTGGDKAHGIWAKSLGGNAGSGGSGGWLTGSPGGGGQATDGGSVSVTSGSTIFTFGNDSYGIYAQSVGGFGGNGGGSSGIFYSAGGDGNSAGSGGAVSVVNQTNGNITTSGARAHAIYAQSIGGGGGSGGGAGALVGVGGTGAAGGNGGSVSVENYGQIQTSGQDARGIYAQSIGGGGGDGGNSSGAVAVGGKGSGTSGGGTVNVLNRGTILANSHAIFAESIGGGGGSGGSSSGWFSVGGSGGGGGNASTVSVDSAGQLQTIEANSSAIFAQSVGGGGGNGGNSVAVGAFGSVAIGGDAGTGGNGSNVNVVSQSGKIETFGTNSHGIFAQSVGGGGGNGGYAVSAAASPGVSVSIGIGGTGGGGGLGDIVNVGSHSDITTHGENSHGIFAQSVGGGGGSGGFSIAVSFSTGVGGALSLGGSGGAGNDAKAVTVGTLLTPISGNIETFGNHSYGILAQSVGGGGGDGGFSMAGTLTVDGGAALSLGGSGASGGAAGPVNLFSASSITTHGNDAHGLFAQSLGGGGGSGGFSIAGNISASVALGASVGGSGAAGGNADNVTLRSTGQSISTFGDHSYGAVAQSVGGGGGDGGFAVSGSISSSAGVNLGLGGSGGTGSSAGNVDLESSSSISTRGINSHGLFAQSVGGGGGSGGFSIAGGLSGSQAIDAGIGGNGAGGGNAGNVNLNSTGATVSTAGERSYGLLAQSLGGGGGDGGFSIAGGISKGPSVSFGLGGKGDGGGDGGNVVLSNLSTITTLGSNSHAIFVQSVGGGGGSGGFSVAGSISADSAAVSASIGGAGGGGGNAGNVSAVSQASSLSTSGQRSDGILAQSIGGGGGDGGFSVAGGISKGPALDIGIGGKGAGGGNGGSVSLANSSAIQTGGELAYGILAQSVGGGGGSGGFSIAGELSKDSSGLTFAMGGKGGGGGDGGVVTVNNSGAITNYSTGSHAILAQSIGGGGGAGGFAGSISGGFGDGASLAAAVGGSGAGGGRASSVSVTNFGLLTTGGDAASGIYAQSVGGGGGDGGFSLAAAFGTGKKAVNASIAVGGHGGNGNVADKVFVDNENQILTYGSNSLGIFAQSIGGGGGNGGFSASGDLSSSTNAKQLSVSIGGNAGTGNNADVVTVTNHAAIMTAGPASSGIQAQSIGGGGGNGGFSFAGTLSGSGAKNVSVAVGGTGGAGGLGSNVNVSSSSTITTFGDDSHGIFAQSLGGGGGHGGGSVTLDLSAGASSTNSTTLNIGVSVGGEGGDGRSAGNVDVLSIQSIVTSGTNSHAIYAQSIGGGGGDGGFSVSASAALKGSAIDGNLAIGGGGGNGNTAGAISVVNLASLDTFGTNAYGILAQSIGGGGGNGGFSVAGGLVTSTNAKQLSISLGGAGGTGNDGGTVNVSNTAAIMTRGLGSLAIFAQSVGGGGGNGGFSFTGDFSQGGSKNGSLSIGGSGAGAGNGGLVQVNNAGEIVTMANDSEGIFAQSVGGGGGRGGWSAAIDLTSGSTNGKSYNLAVSIGGNGGAGGTGGDVHVSGTSDIFTSGDNSQGIVAQSLGGGGGKGGYSLAGSLTIPASGTNLSLDVAVGGSGGNGNNGGAVTVNHSGSIGTTGDGAHGIFAQSLGGGGGLAGDARSVALFVGGGTNNNNKTFNLSIGGSGGGASDGGTVGVTNVGDISTAGGDAHGIFAQSIGGGGGAGGNGDFGKPVGVPGGTAKASKSLQITVGGSAGSSGNGAEVDIDETGHIVTQGDGSMGILAQSIGGGGGIGGNGETGLTGKIAVGGGGGAAGDGGNVNVNLNGDIDTLGAGASGIFAQSVGGGGGAAGDVTRGLHSRTNIGIGLAFGQNGGSAGNGGIVNVVSTGNIVTRGSGANGIFAQSVGGGGGVAGDLGNNIAPLSFLNFAGSVGGGGSAGAVNINHTGNIMTFGDYSHGIYAQSAGGTNGFGGNVSITLNGSVLAQGAESDGIFAQSRGDKGNGNITLELFNNTVQGGSGQAAGIRITDGANNTVHNSGTVTALSGLALIGNNGNESIENDGLMIGSVDLGAGHNIFHNDGDGRVEGGSYINIGAGNLFMNNGDLAPGGLNAIQSTALTATFRQLTNGVTHIKLGGPSVNDRVNVNGTAALDGKLSVGLFGGYLPRKADQFTVFTASQNITGRYFSMFDPLKGVYALQLGTVYSANSVVLQTLQDSYSQFAITPNQHSVAQNLDTVSGLGTMGGDPREAALVAFLNTVPGTNLPVQLDLISPASYGALFDATAGAADIHARNVERRTAELRAGTAGFGGFSLYDPKGHLDAPWAKQGGGGGGDLTSDKPTASPNAWHAFAIGSGQILDVGDTANAAGYDIETAGATLGADRRVSDSFAYGLTAGYVGDRAFLVNGGRVTVNGGRAGAYGTWFGDGPYLNGSVEGGYNYYDTRRTGIGGTAAGSTSGPEIDALLGGGFDLKRDRLTFGPVASVQYTYIEIDNFTETGSMAPLHLEDNHSHSFRSLLGGRVAYDLPVDGITLRPELQLGWQHEFLDVDRSINSRFATGAGNVFRVTSPTLGRDNLAVSAGVGVQWSRSLGTSVYYDGELARQNYVAHTINVAVSLNF
jgi:uncharacterized protein YhjY with autotransporter beta-barrel domain